MGDDIIQKLYKNCEILQNAVDKSEHEQEYLEILEAVKGSNNEKRLASQLIARFFKHFPHFAEKAIDAHLDLCEDDAVAIRKQAIKDLPALAKDSRDHLPKIADVLVQLLQIEDTSELAVVHSSLLTLLRTDAKGALSGIFSQILSGEELVRERALKFLCGKLKGLGADVLDNDAEELMLEEIRKVMHDVTAQEFQLLLGLAGQLRVSQTTSGQMKLLELVAEQVEFDKTFDASDSDSVDRLIQCLRHALPYFSLQVKSTSFVSYMCLQVLPVMENMPATSQLEVMKLFAELTSTCGALSDPKASVEKVINKLQEQMPLPPAEELDDTGPKLDFSRVECLLYAFHQLAKGCPEFLTENQALLKDFKLRLQYLARGTQGYIKCLRDALQGKSADEMRSEENKLKVVALKTTSNINTLVKDLFHSPPSYKAKVSVSWKPVAAQSKEKTSSITVSSSAGQKRYTPITFDERQAKQSKGERELYIPPSGKYSTKAGSFVPPRRGGRGGNNFRGSGYRGGRGGNTWRQQSF